MTTPGHGRMPVYVVDDDVAVLDSLALLLRMNDYEPKTYRSARAFLERPPAQDRGVVVIDVNMAELDGLSLLEKLKARHFKLPCVMMTGSGHIAMAVKAMKLGAVDFIEKPFEAKGFVALVQSAANSSGGQIKAPAKNDGAQQKVESLTPRERELMLLLAQGEPNKAIAARLGISVRTVEIHRAHMMSKLGTKSVAEVVRLSIGLGLLP